jgi:transcriptional regulator with XRE-family HTH domain
VGYDYAMHVPETWRRDPHRHWKGLPYNPQTVAGMEAFGRSLRAARLRAGLSQAALERLSGLDQTVISRLENGRLGSLVFWRLASLIGALGSAWDPPRLEQDAWGRWNLTPDMERSLLAQIESLLPDIEPDQSDEPTARGSA